MILDALVKNFCYLFNCFDIMENMTLLWKQLVMYFILNHRDTATKDNKKDDLYWEGNLVIFVENLYSVLYNDKFAFDFSDPYRTSLGNPDLKNTRKSLINSLFNLKSEQIKKQQEDTIKYKPFTINEMIGDKVQIIEKIEEMHELSARSTLL
jgi:hypothetical protein